jgi:hypothetical protein
MTLRWRRTIDESPHCSRRARRRSTTGCSIVAAGRSVASISPAAGHRSRRCTPGGLTVPPGLQANGETSDLDVAKSQMIAAMRRWAIWAGVRQQDGSGPVTPRWVLAQEHEPGISTEITASPKATG